jgi:ribosome maturation factor RimP
MTNAPTNPAPRSFGSPVADAVAALVSPIVSDLELEIYDLEFSGGVVRVEVDTPTGQQSGVSLDKIALITRLLGRELDHNDPVPGRYTLEVSSPGLERNLRRAEHYQREVGKTVSLRLHTAIDGARRFQGILAAATSDSPFKETTTSPRTTAAQYESNNNNNNNNIGRLEN